MRRLLFGFLGGVAVTSLVFLLSDAGGDKLVQGNIRATDDFDDESGTVGSGDDPLTSRTIFDQRNESGEVAVEAITATQEPTESSDDNTSREASLSRELEEVRQALADVRADRDYLLRAAARADGPVVSPISLPPEFDWLSENLYRGLFHEQIQREYIDADWASATETKISDFIYGRPELVQKYGVPTIRCHTTMCEVTFLTSGIYDDPSVDDADTAFRDLAFEEMNDQFACGPGECWGDANSEDGVVTIYWAVTRNNAE